MFVYTVRATLPDQTAAEDFVAWLRDGHVQDVIDAGARSGEITCIDSPDDAHIVEVRDRFASREVFDAYEHHRAPRLRQEGLERFGPDRGISFERNTGERVALLGS